MGLLLFLFWRSAVEGAANLLSRNSRFGGFNSRLGRFEFPVRSATGIGWQRLDLPYRFRGQTALEWGKSVKFPVQREKTGIVSGKVDLSSQKGPTPRGMSAKILTG
jgi:hypothetical protein